MPINDRLADSPPADPRGLGTAFETLASFADATDELGVDASPLALLPEVADEGATIDDRPLPDEGDDEIDLSDAERAELARSLCAQLQNYDAAMSARHTRWDEIEDAYDLVSTGHGGEIGESESLTSEWLMSAVDQATARIEEAILGAEPLARVRPLSGRGDEAPQWAEDALSTERVLNNYVRREAGFDNLLPVISHRTVKLGTTVLRLGWERRRWVSRYYDSGGNEVVEPQEDGGVEFELIPNRAVVLWPPDVVDWQRAEMVGHRAVYGHARWRDKCRELKMSDADVETIETGAMGEDGRRPGDPMPATLDDEKPAQQLTELWCDLPLPGEPESTRFLVFLHEESRTILRIYPNRHPEQEHPYFPVRYKLTDKSAWGDGLGDEALTSQSVDSALRTMSLDNVMAGAYWINWVRAGSVTDMNLDRLRPGEILRGDNPDEFKPMKMGGDAPEVDRSIEANRYYGREATGLASVLQGQGDPTMKSGAGTGSTLALIDQAMTKFNAVGRRFKFDLAPVFRFALSLLGRYATDGLLYRVATRDDAGAISLLRWKPPRARIADILHVEIQAPSASTSNEARKQSYLMLWTFCSQFVQTLIQHAGPLLGQQNPQGYTVWLSEWAEFLTVLARRIVEVHDLPGLREMVPSLPEPTPADELIAQQQQEIGSLQQQIQQLIASAGQPVNGNGQMAAGAPPAPPANGAGAMEGML